MMVNASKAEATGSFATIFPYAGWVLAGLLAIWIAKQFFGRLFQEFGLKTSNLILKYVSRSRITKRAMRKYRRALIEHYQEHPLGFRREGTVNINQVYVSLQYLENGYRKDIARQLDSMQRAVVLGEPGAGKSLLMKRLLISWATRPSSGGEQMPILVELHRCNGDDKSLKRLVSDELERNGVFCRDEVIARALRDGQFLIIFDGLDEVTRENQAMVIQLIKDFVVQWNSCRYITTCRGAVYTGQLAPQFSHVLSIADFDDAGIRRLLAKWPGLGHLEADRFFTSLTESPQLIRLAGSPLLLTMMIYLQTEVFAKAGRNLPTSRAAFYDLAVDHLLARDRDLARDDALSVFEGVDKRAALQQIAITLQSTPVGHPDRRSIERAQLIECVNGVGKQLNLRDQDIVPLIKEIIERSQLLIELGGHSKTYVFRHLTLQEYLAASELRNNPAQLLANYRLDPDGWRETVKLWCGVTANDCTPVVKELFGTIEDRLLALQCAADATSLEPNFADKVINYHIARLEAGDSQPAAEIALGAIASDERPRSVSVLGRLEALFLGGGQGRAGAGRALAATRRAEAADILGRQLNSTESARTALRTMGEQAVPVLAAAARTGDMRSVDDLGEVRTASAAAALSGLIWDDSATASRAAWWLAALMRSQEVEDGLGSLIEKSGSITSGESLSWIWQSQPPPDVKVAAVMGRVGHLLNQDAGRRLTPDQIVIDRRIAVPIVAINARIYGGGGYAPHVSNKLRHIRSDSYVKAAASLAAANVNLSRSSSLGAAIATVARSNPDVATTAFETLLTESKMSLLRQNIFRHMHFSVQCAMVDDDVLDSKNRPILRREQWVDAATPATAPRLLRAIFVAMLVLAGFAVCVATAYRIFGPWFGHVKQGATWVNLLATVALAIVLLVVALFVIDWSFRISRTKWRKKVVDWIDLIMTHDAAVALTLISTLVLLVNAFLVASALIGWVLTGALAALIILLYSYIGVSISKRSDRLKNPFRKYIGLSEEAILRSLLAKDSAFANVMKVSNPQGG